MEKEPPMRRAVAPIVALMLAALAGAAAAEDARKPPYWASISAGQARARTGPARTYPASWLYQRAGLPVKVVAAFKEWRKVEDPDGDGGWIQANLLSATRTAMIHGADPATLRALPSADGAVRWRAAPGVVGRVSQCGNGWCAFDVKGRAGFVETSALWGVEAGETLP